MSESTKKLLNLIDEGKSLNQICKELNKTPKQIFNHLTMLKNSGYLFNRNYYYSGDIHYTPNTNFNVYRSQPYLGTYKGTKCMKAVAISDTHIGSNFERLDLLNEIYNYCTKEGITMVFHCGDIIDNVNIEGKVPKEERVEYLLKNYPYDKNILTFNIFGNHDASMLFELKQNMQVLLENYRHDLVNLGYEQGALKVKKDSITLFHNINNSRISETSNPSSIYLLGHTHTFSVNCKLDRDNLKIKVPALSDINTKRISYPSALELEIYFEDEVVSYVYVRQLIYNNNEFTPSGELQYAINNKEKKEKLRTLSK